MVMTREELVQSIQASLREADRQGLIQVGIRLNDAIVALDNTGVLPLEPTVLTDPEAPRRLD